MTHTLHKSL